ncbi:Uncharacterised protein [uncultured archaeon]|nr:Uncharacterised protein [uncultured archaeon]
MSRRPGSEGGWFKMWGRKWLTDSKLISAGDAVELSYVRVLCLANVKFKDGYFLSDLGHNLTEDEICRDARINPEVLKSLVTLGFLVKEAGTGTYHIPNWEKYQSRSYRKPQETVEKPQEKPQPAPPPKASFRKEDIRG